MGLVYFTAPLAPGKSEEVLLVGVCFALVIFSARVGHTYVSILLLDGRIFVGTTRKWYASFIDDAPYNLIRAHKRNINASHLYCSFAYSSRIASLHLHSSLKTSESPTSTVFFTSSSIFSSSS